MLPYQHYTMYILKCNMDDNFFKEKYFEEIMRQMGVMQKDISVIKSRIGYIYGFAGAIGFITTIIIEWVRSKIHI